jgi:pimeloyl-ACP methyl ester carboxylesterase
VSTGIRTRELVIGGVRSPVWEAGPAENGEAVVFVHGNPGPAEEFVPLLEQVGTFARALAPDMPGFGRADKPEEFDYTVEGYARHLAGVLDTLEVRRVHLVLHDFGGPWGLQWAATHPDQFASVVLINTGALLDYRWHFFARLWRRKFVGEATMATLGYPAFNLTMRLRAKRRIQEPALRRMWDNSSGETRRAVLKLYRATDAAWYGEEHRRMLRPLRRPALVLWGARDIFLSEALAARQREVFPDAQVDIFRDSGHFPYLDSPEAVAGAVLPFLRAQRAASVRKPNGVTPGSGGPR